MKFTCPKCNARYSLAADKVPPAVPLRFTCKTCGEVIRVRRDDHEATRVAPVEELAEIQEASARAALEGGEWYVLINRQPVGPLSTGGVADLLARGDVTARTYVWREGLAEWVRLGVVDVLAAAAPSASSDRSKTATIDARVLHEYLERSRHDNEPDDGSLDGSADSIDATAEPVLLENLASVPAAAGLVTLEAETPTRAPAPAPAPWPDADAFGPSSPAGAAPSGTLGSEVGPTGAAAGASPSMRAPLIASSPPAVAALDVVLRPPMISVVPQAAPAVTDAGLSPLSSPPGETTQLFVASAGLYRRSRRQRHAAAAAIGVTILLLLVLAFDVAGVLAVPGMGALYEATGLADPNVGRATARVRGKLRAPELTANEREALRRRLLSLESRRVGAPPKSSGERGELAPVPAAGPSPARGESTHDLAVDVFTDERKREAGVRLAEPATIRASSPPSGLNASSLAAVVADNGRAVELCVEEAVKKGERASGRMDLEVTVAADGNVVDAAVPSPQYRGSELASCTIRRVKSWRFPRFEGAPVTVVFPYVLSAGL